MNEISKHNCKYCYHFNIYSNPQEIVEVKKTVRRKDPDDGKLRQLQERLILSKRRTETLSADLMVRI